MKEIYRTEIMSLQDLGGWFGEVIVIVRYELSLRVYIGMNKVWALPILAVSVGTTPLDNVL